MGGWLKARVALAGSLLAVGGRGVEAGEIQARAAALSGQHAPGTPDGVTFAEGYAFFPSIFASGGVEFSAVLSGPAVNPDNDAGIWSEASGALTLVAREGDPAPGAGDGVVYRQIIQHQSSSSGHIVLQASLSGSGVNDDNNLGVWSNTAGQPALVARTGHPAPGVDGAVFAAFDEVLINEAGQVAFIGRLSGPGVDETNESGIWSEASGTLTLVTRGGLSHAPGSQRLPFRKFYFLALNNAGQVAFSATLSGGLQTSGIWMGSDTLTEIAVASEMDVTAGDPAPGAPFASFRSLVSPVEIDDAGRVVFYADLSGVDAGSDSGIWLGDASGVTLVAREGDIAGGTSGGIVFDQFERSLARVPALNAGRVAFLARLRGTGVSESNDEGCWTRSTAGEIRLLARRGDAVPDETALLFSGLGYPSLNDQGQAVFGAVLQAAAQGNTQLAVCMQGSDQIVRVAVRDADTARLSGGAETFTGVSQGGGEATGGRSGRSSSVNGSGQLVFSGSVSTGRRGAFVTPAAGADVDEPESDSTDAMDVGLPSAGQFGACGAGALSLLPAMLIGLLTAKASQLRRKRMEARLSEPRHG